METLEWDKTESMGMKIGDYLIIFKNSRYSYYPEPSVNEDENIQRNTEYSQVDLFQKFYLKLVKPTY